MNEETTKNLDLVFEPLYQQAVAENDEFDALLALATRKGVSEIIEITEEKENFSVAEIEKIIPEVLVEAMYATVGALAEDEKDILYLMARKFDSPDKWYYCLSAAMQYYIVAANIVKEPRACYNLGCIYFNGQTDEKHNFRVNKDYTHAAAFFSYAVAFGERYPRMMCQYLYSLAEMYFYGWGVKQDFYKVITLCERGLLFKLPFHYQGKAERLMLAAMNIKDGIYANQDDECAISDEEFAIPDDLLERVEVNALSVILSQTGSDILNSKQAKVETLLFRQKLSCSGEYTYKCPNCGSPMVVRVAQKEIPGKYPIFLGCTAYPNCKHTEDVILMMKSEKSGGNVYE